MYIHFCICTCRYCHQKGTIGFFYMCLHNKILRWCSNPLFYETMTAHWNGREFWLGVGRNNNLKNEIWNGSRFKELSWFWNPDVKWIVPVLCPTCKEIVSSTITLHLDSNDAIPDGFDPTVRIFIECPNCFTNFKHAPKVTRGDPRTIALIGHWDGWQPFSTSGKHSCGKCMCSACIISSYIYCINRVHRSVNSYNEKGRLV